MLICNRSGSSYILNLSSGEFVIKGRNSGNYGLIVPGDYATTEADKSQIDEIKEKYKHMAEIQGGIIFFDESNRPEVNVKAKMAELKNVKVGDDPIKPNDKLKSEDK